MHHAVESISPSSLTSRKILIVDDDRLNRRILAAILEPEGFQVTEADSGEMALELYPQISPDLVLLDVVLPGINGFDLCRAVAQMGRSRLRGEQIVSCTRLASVQLPRM